MKTMTSLNISKTALKILMAFALSIPAFAFAGSSYLAITMKIDPQDRAAAGAVYSKYKAPFLKKIKGAQSKQLLIRDDDVQVLHRFATKKDAENYLASDLFTKDVVVSLKPLMKADPEIRIYSEN